MKKYRVKKNSVVSRLSRREVLGLIWGTVAVSLVGCLRGQSASVEPTGATQPNQPTTAPACVVKPEQTEGPYFVDEKLNRSDIRSNPSGGSVKQGVRLAFRVSQIDGSSCTPLSGAIIDVWHCDALGVYSDVTDRVSVPSGKSSWLSGHKR